MKFTTPLSLVALLSLLLGASPVRADDKQPDFSADGSIGYLADGNVNVTQLDTSTDEGDTGLELKLDLGAGLPISEQLTLSFGYGYDAVRYEQFDEFDFTLHRARAALDLAALGFDASLAGEQYLANLDGDRFLTIRQVTPSIGRLVGSRVYLRGAFTMAEKEYDINPQRGGNNRAARADAYLLLDGMNRFVSLGFVTDAENTRDDAFEYDGERLFIGAGQRFGGDDRYLMLRARAQIERRDYRGITDTIEAKRRDDRFRTDVTATLGLAENWSLEGMLAWSGNDSNVEAASYDEVMYTLRVGVSF